MPTPVAKVSVQTQAQAQAAPVAPVATVAGGPTVAPGLPFSSVNNVAEGSLPTATANEKSYDLDGMISTHEIVISTLEEIPADLGVDDETVEPELIEGLAAFAKWIGFNYDPKAVRTFSVSPKKNKEGYYFNSFRLAPLGDGIALLWGGNAIPLEGPLALFQTDWRFKVSTSQDQRGGETHKLIISVPKFNLSFVPRLREGVTYEDFNLSSLSQLGGILATSNDRKDLGDLPRLTPFTIDDLELLVSKAEKPYGVFKITLDDGRRESCYAPPLDSLKDIAYPAVGVIDEAGDNISISSGDKTYVLPVPLGGAYISLGKLPDGEYRLCAVWEDNRFGPKIAAHVVAPDGKAYKVTLNIPLINQLSLCPPPTRQEPLTLHINGRKVMVDDKWVKIDGKDWTIDLETKEVRHLGVVKPYDRKIYLTEPRITSANRKRTKIELLAERGKAAASAVVAATAESKSTQSAFN